MDREESAEPSWSENEAAWAVVVTKPQAEQIAHDAIADLGYEAWLPMYRKRLSGTRIEQGRRIRSRQDGFDMRPLILSHLFVLVPYGDAAWCIDEARGARRLFRYAESDMPKRARWSEMRRLRAALELGLFDVGLPFNPGDILQTPQGFVGELLSLDERGRFELMAEIMGEKRIIRGKDVNTLQRVAS